MNMDPARLQRLLQLFDEALEQPIEARAAWLALACGEDVELLREVEAMLVADAGEQTDPITPKLDLLREEASAPADLPAGTRIGPWNLQGVLGRGGMGAVYRVERVDGAYQHQAALKRIRIGLDSALARQRFLRERQILARLQHPHIAGVLDGGVDEHNAPYFVMPLVAGERIDHWCDARALDVRSRVRLLLQVLDAVAFAHRQLVVHRDLKPSNIAVNEAGHAFLLDFGIAKLMEDDDAGQTRTGERAFTPEYASPEQLHGEPVSTATDLYQLGVLTYALLAQAHPYGLTGETPLRTRLVRMDGDPQPLWDAALQSSADDAAKRGATPAALAKQLRGDLSAIAERCLTADATQRYGSVDALRADLLAWLDGRPVAARAPTRRYRMGRFIRRNALAVGAATAVVLALCAGLGVALWQAREARLQAQRADVVNAYLVDVFSSIDPDEGLGPDVSVQQLIDQGVARLDRGELVGQPGAEGKLRLMMGRNYMSLGVSDSAEKQLQLALSLLPEDQVDDLFEARFGLGELRVSARENAPDIDARLQADEAWLQQHASALSDPELDGARLQMLRANLLQKREQFPAAEVQAQQAWQRMRRVWGENAAATLDMLIGYVEILRDMSRNEDALALAPQLVAGYRQLKPVNPFRLATALYSLGELQRESHQAEQALASEQEALQIRRRILPADHPLIADTLGSLAMVQQGMGHFSDALPLHQEAVAILRTKPSNAKFDLARELNNLGGTCFRMDDLDCAATNITQALAIWDTILPADHRTVLTARGNLAKLYAKRGQLREGEAVLRQVLSAREAAVAAGHGGGDDGLSSTRGALTDNLLQQGRNAEALVLAQTRQRDIANAGKAADKDAVSALNFLALAELANRQPALALPHAQAAFDRAHAAGMDGAELAYAQLTLARCLLASGKPAQAVPLARDAATISAASHKPDGINLARAHGVLGHALLASNQRAEGGKEISAAIAILSKQAPWLPELAELRRLR